MSMRQFLVTLSLAVCGLAPSVSSANLIVNGSFELPPVTNSGPPAGLGFDYHSGNGITGWTITGTKELLFTSAYNPVAPGGNQTLQLESVSDFFQTFTTSAGAIYTLSFDYGAWDMNSAGVMLAPLEVKIDGAVVASLLGSNQLYQTHSLTFTADDTSTTLAFRNSGVFGQNWAQVDNVSVVPEPASLALLGLGLFGIAALRRKKA